MFLILTLLHNNLLTMTEPIQGFQTTVNSGYQIDFPTPKHVTIIVKSNGRVIVNVLDQCGISLEIASPDFKRVCLDNLDQ
jgi:hypothetical protein